MLSDRVALAWVLRDQRMAFHANRAADARALAIGDRLFVYTTRGCFHNPTRDRGRVIGEATIASGVSDLDEPVELAGRTFSVGCRLRITKLARLRDGVELAPLVPRLATFPNPRGWRTRMRQTLVPLHNRDIPILEELLAPLLQPRATVIGKYLAAAQRGLGDSEP